MDDDASRILCTVAAHLHKPRRKPLPDGGSFLIAGPGWKGEAPKGITKVIRSETDLVSVVGRTQLFNAADLENVKRIQAGYKVQPLSAFAGTPAPPPAPAIAWITPTPPAQDRTSLEFFNQLAFLLKFAQPPHPSEAALRERFAKLGIEPASPLMRTACRRRCRPRSRRAWPKGRSRSMTSARRWAARPMP